jgi:hypothetical protein
VPTQVEFPGEIASEPNPDSTLATPTLRCRGPRKVAPICRSLVSGKVHVEPVTIVHGPGPQPVNFESGLATAVTVMLVPLGKVYGHCTPPPGAFAQVLPPGETCRLPLPSVGGMDSSSVRDSTAKVAPIDMFCVTVNEHDAVPAQVPPLQPEKTELAWGCAARVTVLP